MENLTIRNVLDSLTTRGVLSADGRRQVFRILEALKVEHNQEVDLLKNDISNLRTQREALLTKISDLEGQLTKKKK